MPRRQYGYERRSLKPMTTHHYAGRITATEIRHDHAANRLHVSLQFSGTTHEEYVREIRGEIENIVNNFVEARPAGESFVSLPTALAAATTGQRVHYLSETGRYHLSFGDIDASTALADR